ncbi:hypothetical protein FOS14_00065 [Skermania sp. ID1734]|uniref:hypothetical protein n=1 Tax=Skermania sp. ID1734 TaxID=2597516 RepID=UPI00117FF872|nr:hypothetical protein [Skermania sp. ID1734]TSE01834.1 hypothetical protein FOS14_00065 [Skermania sp. ID1734]
MRSQDISEPSESITQERELAVVADEFGALLIGDETVIEEFEKKWAIIQPGAALVVPDQRIGIAAQGIGSSALRRARPISRYLAGDGLWSENSPRPAPGTVVTYHATTRSASSGRILSNPQILPQSVAGGPFAVAMLAVEAALAQQTQLIEARLDQIEDKVDDVLRLASAQRLGDVYGHRRILQRRLKDVSDGNVLTDTDWSSIASLGADLEVGVERLRFHAMQVVTQLNPQDTADERAEQLKAAVKKGRLRETLSLLLIAQQSLYIWQRLRLERIRSTEPQYLHQAVDSARSTLKEHAEADRELAETLRRLLDRHAALRISEVHRVFSGRAFDRYRVPLTEALDHFVEARALQIESWSNTENARLKDAYAVARERTRAITKSSRQQAARGIAGLARFVEPNSDTDGSSHEEPSAEQNPDPSVRGETAG